MEVTEVYWETASESFKILLFACTGYSLAFLFQPFLLRKKRAWGVGLACFGMELFLYYIPLGIMNYAAYGISCFTALFAAYFLDRRNIRQKIYLTVTFFVLRWIAAGWAGYIYICLFDFINRIPQFAALDNNGQFIICICTMLFHLILILFFMQLAVLLVIRHYHYKRDEIMWRELFIYLLPALSVMIAYLEFQLLELLYEQDTGQVLADRYAVCDWIEKVYQIVSFGVILKMVAVFQDMKRRQREERQDMLLAEQTSDLKRYIRQVEKWYGDMRSLKHDMGNHIMTLENLYEGKELEAAKEYAFRLHQQLEDMSPTVKTGNPVTDVVLSEKKREAEGNGIAFLCSFFYPKDGAIDAFDISVILYNAVNNALEAACGCPDSYIHLSSYRRNNTFLIEVKNTFQGELILDEKTGLPVSSKKEAGHGYGLSNIRKTAQKYLGDIMVEQAGTEFVLSVMLLMQ